MTTPAKVATDFHPDYGLGDAYRAQVLRYAETYGVPSAAKHFNLAPSTVYDWRNRMNNGDNHD